MALGGCAHHVEGRDHRRFALQAIGGHRPAPVDGVRRHLERHLDPALVAVRAGVIAADHGLIRRGGPWATRSPG